MEKSFLRPGTSGIEHRRNRARYRKTRTHQVGPEPVPDKENLVERHLEKNRKRNRETSRKHYTGQQNRSERLQSQQQALGIMKFRQHISHAEQIDEEHR